MLGYALFGLFPGTRVEAAIPFPIGDYFFYSMIGFCGFATIALRVVIRPTWSTTLLLLVQTILTFATIYNGVVIGRLTSFGPLMVYPMIYLVLFTTAALMTRVWPRTRIVFENFVLTLFCISAGLAVLQILRVPGSFALQITGGLAEEGGAVRATGLTNFPATGGFHSLCGLAILTGRLVMRKLTWWELGATVLLALFAIGAQYRSLYPGFLIIAVTATMLYGKHGRQYTAIMLGGLVFGLASLVALFPEQLSYAFSLDTYSKSSELRQKLSYAQFRPLFDNFFYTGIGQDTALSLGTPDPNIGGKDKWTNWYADNSYALLLATAGITGLVAGIATMATAITGLVRGYLDRATGLPRKARMVAAALAITSFAIAAYNANFIVFNQVYYLPAMLAGLAMPTWWELEEESRHDSGIFRRYAAGDVFGKARDILSRNRASRGYRY